MYTSRVYKIMIAAPEDIRDEIHIVKECIYEWSRIHSEDCGVVLLPFYWKSDCHPGIGERTQEVINKQVTDGSDMLVSIIGSRLGTPAGAGSSGTVEEIERHRRMGKPVMLYFKDSNEGLSAIDLHQLEQVRRFKAEICRNVLYRDYSVAEDFRICFDRDLHRAADEYFVQKRRDPVTRAERTSLPAVRQLAWFAGVPASAGTGAGNGNNSGRSGGAGVRPFLSEWEFSQLKLWTNIPNPSFDSVLLAGNEAIYFIGEVQFRIRTKREELEWKYFFDKLLYLGLITERPGRNGKTKYDLRKEAYEFVRALNCND